jgi:hypothetical protein
MVNYTCPTCLKDFNKRCNYVDHIERRKNPCQSINQILTNINQISPILTNINQNSNNQLINSNICEYCEKSFVNIYTLNRHINGRCKIKKQLDEDNELKSNQFEELKKILEEQSKQINEQSKQIEELKKKKSNTKNINNNITVNTNTDNSIKTINTDSSTKTINIMPHGSEDFSKIDLKTILKHLCTQDFINIVPNMAKEIFMNKNRPEFSNFEVLDLSRNKCKYYDGDIWLIGKTDDGIVKVFTNVNTILTEPFDKENEKKTMEFIEKDKDLKKNKSEIKWSKNYCNNLWNENDKEYLGDRDKIYNELKLSFFNNKNGIKMI